MPVSTDDFLWQPCGTYSYIHKGPVRKGTILARFPAGQHQHQFHAMPSVAFGESPSHGEEVYRTLYFMRHLITRITDEFEAAFFSPRKPSSPASV